MPSAVWVAIEHTGWKPKVGYPPIRFVRFSSRALKEGVKRHRIAGIEVPIFEPAKTTVDCFRYRNKIGPDIAPGGCAKRCEQSGRRRTSSGNSRAQLVPGR